MARLITLWWGLDGDEETGYLADLSRAPVTQGLILSRGRGNSRDKIPIMRACSQTSAVDVWSRHATGGENALRDDTKKVKPLYRPKWPMGPVLNSGFHSMKRLGELQLPLGSDANPSQGYPQYICWYPFAHLGEEKHCDSKVFCLRTQHKDPGEGSNPEHSIRSQAH